jgi:cytochrome c oxidase subunit 3
MTSPLAHSIDLSGRRAPVLSHGTLGMMLLIGSETVLFGCFINAYLVLRMAAPMWPPMGAPSLHIGLSAVNTALLAVSAVTLFKRFLRTTLGLGVLFLILQGIEFYQVYHQGLTLQTGPYGAVFYTLIACHGLHVLGGLVFIAAVLKPSRQSWIRHAQTYWAFVTLVWLVLFSILYIV